VLALLLVHAGVALERLKELSVVTTPPVQPPRLPSGSCSWCFISTDVPLDIRRTSFMAAGFFYLRFQL